MSGIEDPGTPAELPAEYESIYRDAYLRALAESESADSVAAQVDQPLQPAPERTKVRPIWWVVAAIVMLLGAAAWIGWGLLTGGGDEADVGAPSASGSTTRDASTPVPRSPRPTRDVNDLGPVWDGEVETVAVERAEASCTAPEGVDSANRPVAYEVTNAFDGDSATAWRCNGTARGEVVVMSLPRGIEIAEVGLIPGYAKDDPITGADRYAENNRIVEVRWRLADGVVVTQELDPDPTDRSVQRIRVPRTLTDEITLEIVRVERGPRNTTAISTISLAAAS